MPDTLSESKDPENEFQTGSRRVAATPNWESLIDRMLGEAVQGENWQDLKGQGRRINLDAPAGVPVGQVMANKIMRDNKVAPAWIENRRVLLKRIETWRQDLRTDTQNMGIAAVQSERQLTKLRREIEDLNRTIRDANIAIPIVKLELVKLNLVEELRRVQDF